MAVKVPFTIEPLKSDRATLYKNDFLMGLFERTQLPQNQPQWLSARRRQAASWVANLSVPTKKTKIGALSICLSWLRQISFL